MNKYIKEKKKVDYNLFSENINDISTKYGLPREVKFCKKCIISNQRPNSDVEFQHNKTTNKKTINLDENETCDACKQNDLKKNNIDWLKREEELRELCNQYRKNDGSYDCVVPGSGGKDSIMAAHLLKYKYNMHPLTVTWAPHIYTDWGYKNFESWIHAGFDNYKLTPNGRVHRLLTRLAVENIFHPFQPFMMGQKTVAPRIAAAFDIPLIFYGENEAEYGNPLADNISSTRDEKYYSIEKEKEFYIAGEKYSDLKNIFKLTDADLQPYIPMSKQILSEKKIQVHYLGYYIKWHPQDAYYFSIKNSNFKASPERTAGTYSKYNSIDDKIDDFHFFTYFIKYGIGRATYDSAQEVRNEDITRDEGKQLVKKYDGEFPERFADEIFKYLSINKEEFTDIFDLFEKPLMDKQYFMKIAENFRSPHIWKYENKEWLLRNTVWQD